jgi:predicted anti-sigma-YlaC factor YlaD
MSLNLHEQARRLLALGPSENLDAKQPSWLQGHLRECATCRAFAQAADELARALRAQPFAADSTLVPATLLRVRLRALELRRRRQRNWLVGLSCAFVGLSAAITTPLSWRAFEWAGALLGVSNWAWQAAFTFLWIVPALVVSALLMARGAHNDLRQRI